MPDPKDMFIQNADLRKAGQYVTELPPHFCAARMWDFQFQIRNIAFKNGKGNILA